MPYYNFYISRSWLVSETARRVYLVAAILTLVEIGTLLGIELALAFAGEYPRAVPDTIAGTMRLLLFLGVLGAASLWIAMIYFVVNFDRTSLTRRMIWGILFWALGPLASLLYHFIVYRRQTSALLNASRPIDARAVVSQ